MRIVGAHLCDTLKPRLIYEGNIDSLCELVDTLKVEVLEEKLGRCGELVAGIHPILGRIPVSAHQWLAFCARLIFVRRYYFQIILF